MSAMWIGALRGEAPGSPGSLVDAVERRDSEDVQRLLDADHIDINASQADGMSALHWAVYYDDLPLAEQLVEHGADVNAKTRYGLFPLSLAAQNGNGPLVRMLLRAGANPNDVLFGGETPLMTASRTGRVDAVRALVNAGAEVEACEDHGQSALMWGAAAGHVEVVRCLVGAGANTERRLKSGFTPLFFAVRDGHEGVVRLLWQAGGDVNGTMVPEESTYKGPRRGTTPLLLAVENGHYELAAYLLSVGADPNDQRSGFTPLHTLSWVRKPNRGDGEDGDPAPIGSGKLTSLEFVRVLVQHGADVNSKLVRGKRGRGELTHKGATPLLFAAKTADLPYIKLLVELGANPLEPNADQCTPLMAAAGIGTLAPTEEAGTESEALEVLEFLIARGADVNSVDKNGETAMHGAAYKSLPRVVAWLAARGAQAEVWNRENRYGWTPMSIAEGHRPGNFKPSVETLEALQHAAGDPR